MKARMSSCGWESCSNSWRVMEAAPGTMQAVTVASTNNQDSPEPKKFRLIVDNLVGRGYSICKP